MSGKLDFYTENTFDSVAAACSQMDKFAEEQGLSPRKIYQLDLLYEELMTNVVKYSYPDNDPHKIQVILDNDGKNLTFTVIHDGTDFNPWVQDDPDLTVPLEQRQEGGIGIMLCRKFSCSTGYRRENGKSIITVVI